MRGRRRIEQMYAFVALDPEDDTEGVPAYTAPNGMMMPLVGADMTRVESLRPVAQELARVTGVRITLCRFEVRTELEVFEP